jgi:hypothetical protein
LDEHTCVPARGEPRKRRIAADWSTRPVGLTFERIATRQERTLGMLIAPEGSVSRSPMSGANDGAPWTKESLYDLDIVNDQE